MPQQQVLDYKTPAARIMGNLGRGLGEGLDEERERQRARDVMERVTENYSPDMTQNDFFQLIGGDMPLKEASDLFQKLKQGEYKPEKDKLQIAKIENDIKQAQQSYDLKRDQMEMEKYKADRQADKLDLEIKKLEKQTQNIEKKGAFDLEKFSKQSEQLDKKIESEEKRLEYQERQSKAKAATAEQREEAEQQKNEIQERLADLKEQKQDVDAGLKERKLDIEDQKMRLKEDLDNRKLQLQEQKANFQQLSKERDQDLKDLKFDYDKFHKNRMDSLAERRQDYREKLLNLRDVKERAKKMEGMGALKKIGLKDEWIDNYLAAEKGTELELMRHFLSEKEMNPRNPIYFEAPTDEKDGKKVYYSDLNPDFDWKEPPIPRVGGKVLEERKSKRYDENTKLYKESMSKYDQHESTGRRIRNLRNTSRNIELDDNIISKLNVRRWGDEKGQLIMPDKASPAVQSYLKQIYDFTQDAKNSFGARVTNFELGTFLNRLPTLLNSRAGREIILRQMELVNEAEKLKPQSEMEVIENYGADEVDTTNALKTARLLRKDKEKQVQQEMDYLFENMNDIVAGEKPFKPVVKLSKEGRTAWVSEFDKSAIKRARKQGWQ